MKKLIISLSMAVMLTAPVFAFADTATDQLIAQLQAQIAALQAQIAALQSGSGFHDGDRVQVTTGFLRIRGDAGVQALLLGLAPRGATGVIRCNAVSHDQCPVTRDNYTWWYIHWDASVLPSGWSAQGTSEADFLTKVLVNSTTTPSITVLSPNGGELWKQGTTQTIAWSDTMAFSASGEATLAPPHYDIMLDPWVACLHTTPRCAIAIRPYTIAKNVDGYRYDWQVGKIIDPNGIGAYGTGGTASSGVYTIQVCRTGSQEACGSSDSYWNLASASTTAASWSPASSGGNVKSRLQYVSPTKIYGIGLDNKIWRWNGGSSWTQITDSGDIKDNFVLNSESDIYAIGLNNRIWHWDGSAWSTFAFGGHLQYKLQYASPTKIYGIGLISGGIGQGGAIWRYNGGDSSCTLATCWTRITAETIKDDFVLNSESDIYAIGLDNQIWHWDGSSWSPASSGGSLTRRLQYVSPTKIYGIGLDNKIWRWNGGSSWTQITDSGDIKDDFVLNSESDIYGIGTDGQILHWGLATTTQSITISRTPATSATNPYKVGAATTFIATTSPSFFATDFTVTGYNQIGTSTPRTFTYSTTLSLRDSGFCNTTTGVCTIPGIWDAPSLTCPAATGTQQMTEWYTVGGATSNTLTWYFQCAGGPPVDHPILSVFPTSVATGTPLSAALTNATPNSAVQVLLQWPDGSTHDAQGGTTDASGSFSKTYQPAGTTSSWLPGTYHVWMVVNGVQSNVATFAAAAS